jgi:succinoglycan biosynthesis protein ExoW
MTGICADPASCKIAVVIPYYQEEPGILRRSVLSAVRQEGVSDLVIIVVDDGSPAPARDDLKGLDLPAHVALHLIEQPNRGPGAARNRALDRIGLGTAYVALLDSDDCWTPNHLRNALSILETGYDVYFADLVYWKANDTFFFRRNLDPSEHICIDAHNRYFKLVGDGRRQAINSVNPFPASCVVYRWEKFRNLRYHEIAFMGEDLTFWMEMAAETSEIAFCKDVECFSSHGIHIYENSGWATSKNIWRIYHYMRWRKWLRRTMLRNDLEFLENGKEMDKLRVAFVTALLHELRRMRAFGNPDVARFLLLDPQVVWHLAPVTIRVVLRKLGQRSPSS